MNKICFIPGKCRTKSPNQTFLTLFTLFLLAWSCGGSPTPDVKVTLAESWRNERPSWTPDGSKIAFQSNRDGMWEIYLLDLESKLQTRLTHGVDGKL